MLALERTFKTELFFYLSSWIFLSFLVATIIAPARLGGKA